MTDYKAIAQTYRSALPAGQLDRLDIGQIDRLQIPFIFTFFEPTDGPSLAGSGFGTTAEEAEMGALGELSEVLNAHFAVQQMQRFHGSYRQLRSERGSSGIVDPRLLCLEAGSDYNDDRPLQWVETRRYRTGEPVLVPIEFIACQPFDLEPGPWLITLITNGLGAGLSYERAVTHGVLELLQRDGNGLNFRALAGDEALDLADIGDADTRTLLAHLDAQGVEVVAKCASTDFGLPNLYVVGYDREETAQTIPIMSLACGEAVHPSRERALRKAVLEFAAARSRLAFSHGPLEPVAAMMPAGYLDRYIPTYNPANDEQRALAAMRNLVGRSLEDVRHILSRVHAVHSRTPFSDLPTTEDAALLSNEQRLAADVTGRLEREGFDILVANYTPPDSPVQAVKVLVPGLEVETMSYHRIGERNLRRLLERDLGLVGVGAAPAGTARIHLTAEAEERLGGAAWLDTAALDKLVGPLYPLYREPGRHAAVLLERGIVPGL